MSNENKTALTVKEIFNEIYEENKETLKFFDKRTLALGFVKGFNAASLQTQEKDKEIAELKMKCNVEVVNQYIDDNHKLMIKAEELKGLTTYLNAKIASYEIDLSNSNQTIESQQKDIEELKTSIEGVFGWREKNHHLTISEKQLKSQLSEVTKERDELREGMQKIATYRSESISSQIARNLLTPTKE